MTDDITAEFRAAAAQAAAEFRARQNPGTRSTEGNGERFAAFLEQQLAEQDHGLETDHSRPLHSGWAPEPIHNTAAAFSAFIRDQH